MPYGSATGIAALTPRDANAAGRFDAATIPTETQVNTWRAELSAMLDVALAAAGIDAPITDATITPMLDSFVNGNGAWLVESVNGRGRYQERPATTQEILAVIRESAFTWVDANARGIGAVVGVVSSDADAVTVRVGSFVKADGFTGRRTEYATEDGPL